MTEDDAHNFDEEAFIKFFESRGRERSAIPRPIEPQTDLAIDGRISSTIDDNGCVQLNVRVPVDLKTLVLQERARRKSAGEDHSGIGDIVAEALRVFFERRERGRQ